MPHPTVVQYDACCSENEKLFRNAGVSQRLYDEFLEPMLLVLPMCPGEDCSAAAALSCFQYFALEHQVCINLFRPFETINQHCCGLVEMQHYIYASPEGHYNVRQLCTRH